MKLDFSNDRILAVVAHPDDAELLCAGTLARAKSQGAAIAICVMCLGDKGQPARKVLDLKSVRRREMAASAKLLGAHVFTCGIPDGTLQDCPAHRKSLVEILRQFKPTLILGHAPEDYHPDHRSASALSDAASWSCASRGYKTRSPALPAPPELWWMDTVMMSQFVPGFFVDISEYVELKSRMLACHKTQLARGKDSDFSPLDELMRLQSETRGRQAGVAAAEAFRIRHAFGRARGW